MNSSNKLIKYPRSFHLPWSEGATSDDCIMDSTASFLGKGVVVTEKMDGECTTLYDDYIHARSTTSSPHPSRTWVRNFWGGIKHTIPNGIRVCGENVYACHSIKYKNLPSYFFGFSLWAGDVCFSWNETLEWFELIGIIPVPVLYIGVYDEELLINLAKNLDNDAVEGYVVRLSSSFLLTDFSTSLGKYVRSNHVQTDEHWMSKQVIPNGLVRV